jgi:benzoylformate decarboxylase
MTSNSTLKPVSASQRRGADLFVEVLRSEGVRHVLGNPGTTELPLLDALTDSAGIDYVLGLHEASVVAMADGYAQASGRPGFVNLHTAGGLGNAMGAILNAKMANTPLVVTAGQQDTQHGVTDPLLHGDLVGIAGPNTKWAEEIHHPEHIPMLLRRALQDCRTGPAGPVFLSLPVDTMERRTNVGAGEASRIERASVAGALDQLAIALALITPGRLALVVGDEVFAADAGVADASGRFRQQCPSELGSASRRHRPSSTRRACNMFAPGVRMPEDKIAMDPMDEAPVVLRDVRATLKLTSARRLCSR